MDTAAIRRPAWREFEEKVAALFRLKGFEETSDIKVAGRQHDVLLRSAEEHIGSILVECKYFGRSTRQRVGVRDLEDLVARVIRLRNSGDITAGYLVTNSDFTAEAKGALWGRPEEKFVFLRTFDSLVRRLINFEPYLRRFVERYEQSVMYDRYEPLEVLKRQAAGRRPCDEVLNDFIQDQQHLMLLLLGDYGSGKTTSCLHLCYEIAKRARYH